METTPAHQVGVVLCSRILANGKNGAILFMDTRGSESVRAMSEVVAMLNLRGVKS
jgi:hypothetical protein